MATPMPSAFTTATISTTSMTTTTTKMTPTTLPMTPTTDAQSITAQITHIIHTIDCIEGNIKHCLQYMETLGKTFDHTNPNRRRLPNG